MENQPIQNPTSEPTLTPVQVSEPKTKFPVMYLVLSLFILALLASTAFLYYQNMQLKNMLASYQTQPIASPTPTAYQSPIPSTTTDPTANWETYLNASAGFSIKYPTGWRKVEAKNWAGFGPQEIGEDVVWGVSFYNKSEKTVAQIKDEQGKQFSDRKQTEETISFNGLSATKIITTTNQFADWYSVTIIIDSGNMLYAIGNGAQTDKALNEMIAKRTGKSSSISFEDFYSAFKIIK